MLKKSIRRNRNSTKLPPSIPLSLIDLVIPEQLQKLHDGRQFLLYDSNNGLNRILIFSTKSNLELMSKSQSWQIDGTFSAAPLLFSQLYTVHSMDYGISIPLIFALLPNKTQATYHRMIEAIKEIESRLSPSIIMSDFELSAINAFQESFPKA